MKNSTDNTEPYDIEWPKEGFGGIDPLIVAVGRSIAPQVNELLAKLQTELDKNKRGLK